LRINKYLALHLNISRRNADELIRAKKITVNNNLAVIGQDIMTTDVIEYQNKILSSKIVYKYFKFYKPIGYICSTKAQGKSKTIYDILNDNSLKYSGRLDKDSEGLMLLSNDGDWLNNISHPSKSFKKEYIITVRQPIDLNSFKKVVTDKNEKLVINKLTKINKFKYTVTLDTGKNREIRRIFAKNKIEIVNLKRISIGNFLLGDMKIGQLSQIKSN
tara:strand:+ start:857 stop:1507 length:651 start_codon:yes stop_codon:yes gene_type:complete